jgi:ATP-dependent RNA helicase SUPV3L1/SUV3
MSDRPSGQPPARLVAVLGPTNTGKTHLAVERMLGHASGMIGLPLRLLAREVYDRIVKLRGARSVALITGEEKIVPPHAVYFVCTVEAMPLGRAVEFLAIDEIQLCADAARGHVFTHRLLHARGTCETMLLGAAAMGPLIRRLLPGVEIVSRERFSTLSYAGSKKLTRLPRRSAVVAFSADQVYAVAELIRRQRGGAAVVMGSLSPRTRNAQVALFQSGEVDFLVATDAIGMGLNMDVDHVAFAGLRKFDGKRTRWLTPPEVAQIAGRAGRYRRDGTFGVTGECEDMDEDLVRAVEEHAFQPIPAAEWRPADLDFAALPALIRSLARAPVQAGLKLSEPALDEIALKALAQDADIQAKARNRAHLHRLWEVCQTPDFRKTTLEEHLKLVREVFDRLTAHPAARGGGGRLSDDWIAGQYQALDHAGGEIDVLAQRLAGVRTLAYIANRPDWLRNPAEWQGRTRALEDRLSDTLHEKLMQRFIDRRTSVLMRSLSVGAEVLAGVADDGAVTVEGQHVGQLRGAVFDPAAGSSALETKALRRAADRAVAPEIARRLGRLAAEPDAAFALLPDGLILWGGQAAGRVVGGRPFAPQVRLLGDLGAAPVRERAKARLEAFLAAEAARRLAPLKALETAMAEGRIRGLSRGIAYRLIEAQGVLDRRAVAAELKALSQAERRALRSLGVRFAAFSVHMPGLFAAEARVLTAPFAALLAPGYRPPVDRPSRLPDPAPSARALAAYGLLAAGPFAAPVEALERLDAHLRAAPTQAGAVTLTPAALADLGWEEPLARTILKGLGFAATRKTAPGEPSLWRLRREKADPPPVSTPITPAATPFAALAALRPAPGRKPRRKARSRRAAAQA